MSSESSKGSRQYRMSRRAEAVGGTRMRIIEATVGLHGTVGPAGTTIVGIAERAGVTRATVYRHFPDEAALFQACSSHWLSGQDPPDPSRWAGVTDPLERMRQGLADLYRFYRSGETMLSRVYRDKESLPEEHRRGLDARDAQLRELLLSAFPAPARRRHRLRAVIGHALDFWTWRSLCIGQGLSDPDAVDLMVGLAGAASEG